jgi:nitrile hydratase subunit beta
MDGVHDMGGMHGFGPVVVEGGDEVFHEAWEPRVFALYHLSNVRGLVGGPSGRAIRESMDPAHYLEASYSSAGCGAPSADWRPRARSRLMRWR